MKIFSCPLSLIAPLDPPLILHQVRNAQFSLKIMVSAGCGCIFHVGGSVDEAVTSSSLPEVCGGVSVAMRATTASSYRWP